MIPRDLQKSLGDADGIGVGFSLCPLMVEAQDHLEGFRFDQLVERRDGIRITFVPDQDGGLVLSVWSHLARG